MRTRARLIRWGRGTFQALMFIMAIWAVFALAGVAPARAGANCAAAGKVQRAATDLMRAGKSGSAAAMQRALNRHVAMRRVMNFALGRHRRRLTGHERQRFYRQATRYVARRLAALGRGRPGRRVEIVSCRRGLVETRVVPTGERALWKVRGGRIIDVNYRGMWMASLLRSHFDRMMRSAGGDVRIFLARLN